jgi:hypothetical protein
MSRTNRPPLLLTLFAGALLAAGASPAARSASDAGAAPAGDAVAKELVELRTPNSRQWLLENGRVRAEISARATDFRDASGAWQPISPRFVASAEGWRADGSAIGATASDDGAIRLTSWRGGESISASPLAISGLDAAAPAGGWSVASATEIVRSGLDGKLAERIRLDGESLRRELVLRTAPAVGAEPILSSRFDLPEGWTMVVPDPTGPIRRGAGLPTILDPQGRRAFFLLEPVGHDSSSGSSDPLAPETGTTVGRMTIREEGKGSWRVEVRFDGAWLSDPTRVYPVALDPSTTVTSGRGGEVYQYSSGTWTLSEGNPKTNIILSGNRAGSAHSSAGYLQFDISALPPGVEVTGVTIKPYASYVSSAAWLYLWDAGGEAPFAGATQSELAALWADLRGGSSYNAVYVSAVGLLSLNASAYGAHDLAARIPDGIFLVGMQSDGSGTGDSSWRTIDSGQSQLVVDYNPAPTRHIAITEVYTGSSAWVELYNYGYDTDLSNWLVNIDDGAVKSYNIPSGFTLKRHSYVVIHEGGSSASNTTTDLYTGLTINWTSAAAGEVGLAVAGSYGVDYVKWRNPGVTTVVNGQHWTGGYVAGTASVLRRSRDDDTDQSVDWSIDSSSTPGAINPYLHGTRRRHHLVISEVSTNPDAIEVVNYAGVDQELTNWWMGAWANEVEQLDDADGIADWQFPSGWSIPAYGRIRIYDTTASPSGSTFYTSDGIDWDSTVSGEAFLYQTQAGASSKGGNAGADYVAWNNPQSTHLAAGVAYCGTDILPDGSQWFTRYDNLDTDSASDWIGRTSSSLGSLNPGQVEPALSVSDEIGTERYPWTASNYAAGNVFVASADTTLLSFRQAVVLNGAQDVEMALLQKNGSVWSILFQKSFPSMADGSHVLSSGPIALDLASGGTYALVASASGTATWSLEQAAACPELLAFGTWQHYLLDAGGISTSPSEFNQTYAPHQWIETTRGGTLTPLEIVTAYLADGFAGTSYGRTVLATGGYGTITWTLDSGSLPSGLALSTTGLISGTPTGNGVSTFTVRATDSVGQTATRSLSIETFGSTSVTVLSGGLPSGKVGLSYPAQQLRAAGGVGSYTWVALAPSGPCSGTASLPPGLSLSSGGLLSGIPTTPGLFCFRAKATDGGAHSGEKDFSILVDQGGSDAGWVRRGLSPSTFRALALSNETGTPTVFVASRSGRLYRSTSDGARWTLLSMNASLSARVVDWNALVVDPLYYSTELEGPPVLGIVKTDENSTWIVRSTNNGASWQDRTPGSAGTLTQLRRGSGSLLTHTFLAFGPADAWITTNDAATFSRLFPPVAAVMTDLELSPADGSVFMADPGNGKLWQGMGASWTTLSTKSVREIEVSPAISIDGTIWAISPNSTNGLDEIIVSHDGGRSWETGVFTAAVGEFLANLRITADYDHSNPARRTVYWTLGSFDASSRWSGKLYRTIDGGRTVQRVDSNQPIEFDGAGSGPTLLPPVELAFDFSTNPKLYHARTGFWGSSDGGASWQHRPADLDGIAAVSVFRTNDTFFVGSEDGALFKTTNDGATFVRSRLPSIVSTGAFAKDVFAIRTPAAYDEGAADGTVAKTVFAAGAEGLWKSTNGGLTWASVSLPSAIGSNPLTLFELAPSWDGSNGYQSALVIGYQAELTTSALYRSTNGGTTWSNIGPAQATLERLWDFEFSPHYGVGSDWTVVLSYKRPNYVVANNGRGFKATNFNSSAPTFGSLTTYGHLGWIAFPPAYDENSGSGGSAASKTFWIGFSKTVDRGSTFTRTYLDPLCVDPYFPTTAVMYGNVMLGDPDPISGVWRSTDGGATVTALSSAPFDVNPMASCSIPESSGSLKVDATTPGMGFWKSSDRGLTWTEGSLTKSIPNDVRGIANDPNNPQIFYAAVNDPASGIFKSIDGGESFFPIPKGLDAPGGGAVTDFRSIIVCPDDSLTVLAGSANHGIFVTSDGGLNWAQVPAIGDQGTWVDFVFKPTLHEIWAANSAGDSKMTGNCGATWYGAGGPSDFLDFSTPGGGWPLAEKSAKPWEPWSIKAGIWGMSGGAGVQIQSASSLASGPSGPDSPQVAWEAANGSGDYAFPYATCPGQALVTSADSSVALGSCFDGAAAPLRNIYRSTDAGQTGGSNWVPVDLADPSNSGIASSSLNVQSFVESPAGTTGFKDLLAGVVGVLDGGAYLSADQGKHWIVFNEGFDSAELRLQDLIAQDVGGQVYYWAGKPADGLWNRKVAIDPAPVITLLGSTSGLQTGGGNVAITGSYFKSGAVAEFDGIRCANTTFSSSTLVTCQGVPPHGPGNILVTVRNSDTRVSVGSTYTYTAVSGSGEVRLSAVKKSSANLRVEWNDQLRAGNVYRIYRSRNPDFSGVVEVYVRAGESISCDGATCFLVDTRYSPGSNTTTYFYRVE